MRMQRKKKARIARSGPRAIRRMRTATGLLAARFDDAAQLA
ncbi:hypothetical protein T190_22320 [Sinorhizobium meliloti CCBAU 01290]|nr:hypothetical protein T190_22320 [Sinorhizobium meliloti CCBAU 01290]